MLASFLAQNPSPRVLLLSTTNWAVDLALIEVDKALEELSRKNVGASGLRKRCKRIGQHFIASNYKGREHLLPGLDPALVKRIAEVEIQRPDRDKAAEYAAWKAKMSALRSQIPKPIDQAQLAAITTTSAAFSFGALRERQYFDLVVFDEASQVSLPHALALAPLGKKVLFAGDHKQLAPIIQSQHPLVGKWLGVSMFKYMTPANRCFLNEQSRMVEEICEIVSHVFYDGQLILADGYERNAVWRSERRTSFVPRIGTERVHLERCAVDGDFKQTKYGIGTRYQSAEYIKGIVGIISAQVGQENVLVLTPYRAQRGLITAFLRKSGLKRVRVSTIHRAQGSECHTVIFDPVIATGGRLLGHAEEGPRLINVALSRAKARLVVIMSAGDHANEYLRRIAQVIGGTGHFDDAVDLATIANDSGFPEHHIGRIVRWATAVGRLDRDSDPTKFAINDFQTGKPRKFVIKDVIHTVRKILAECSDQEIENKNPVDSLQP
jgi:hypothetical protein